MGANGFARDARRLSAVHGKSHSYRDTRIDANAAAARSRIQTTFTTRQQRTTSIPQNGFVLLADGQAHFLE